MSTHFSQPLFSYMMHEVSSMKRTFIAGLTAGLTMMANIAFAEIDPSYFQTALKDYPGWPIATTCTHSDVNVRVAPNTYCDVVEILQPGELFYIREIIPKENHIWCSGFTARGTKGFVSHKFLDRNSRAEIKSERFRAAFNTSRILNGSTLAAEMGIPWEYNPKKVETLKQEQFSYAPHRYKIGKSWVHGEKQPDGGFWPIGVVMLDSSYQIAGLEVGDYLSQQNLEDFSKNMSLIGWDGPYKYEDEIAWYYEDVVDRQPRPIQGFKIIAPHNTIQEIRYYNIPID